MVEEKYWMYDTKMWENLSYLERDMVIDTLFSLSALSNCERVLFVFPKDNRNKCAVENLKFIGVHAGEKRLGCGEFRMPSTFFALMQYDFMINMMIAHDFDDATEMILEYAQRVLERFKKYFRIPEYEVENDVLVVEVFEKSGGGGYVEAFDKINSIDNEKYEVRRVMPSSPNAIGTKLDKSFGWVNTVGNTDEATIRIREIFGVKE